VKRLVAQELTLSFVPDAEQRLWRTVMRRKHQLTQNRVQVQGRLEALLEEAHIKLSSLVSDLLGLSARRMLQALEEGESDPAALTALTDQRLRATPEQLCDALGACTELNPVYRRLLAPALDELRPVEAQIAALDQEMARLLGAHQEAVQRLAVVPVSTAGPAARPCSGDRGNCPSDVPSNLEDSASTRRVRGTRAGRHETAEPGAHRYDDPGPATPRLPRRTRTCVIGQPSMSGDDFRPWFEELKRLVPAK
jgi:hypothetical protein